MWHWSNDQGTGYITAIVSVGASQNKGVLGLDMQKINTFSDAFGVRTLEASSKKAGKMQSPTPPPTLFSVFELQAEGLLLCSHVQSGCTKF